MSLSSFSALSGRIRVQVEDRSSFFSDAVGPFPGFSWPAGAECIAALRKPVRGQPGYRERLADVRKVQDAHGMVV
ncbi:MAG: hypothetical protein CVU57_03650 [Deltaproteobacteria bacterium HGW-Deltaproteobacteria-15]|nr:MAG: hypothetical protein CVU57_03650 [Deltaproteobacteria bacterium HGW-Deltaproteobacteria-15]